MKSPTFDAEGVGAAMMKAFEDWAKEREACGPKG